MTPCAKRLLTLRTPICLDRIRCCTVIVPRGIFFRRTFLQTAVGRYVVVEVYEPCPLVLLKICFVLCEKTICFSLGLFQSLYYAI